MLKYCLILLTTICIGQIQEDKIKHFGVGAIVGTGAYFVTYKYTESKTKSTIACIGSSVLIGLAKELYDSRKGGTGFNNADLLVTGLGGISAGITINIFKHKSK